MQRPTITKELIAATAAVFCERNGWDAAQAADLASVCRSANEDGYRLARELDSRCGWMPTAQDVETLDYFGCELREAHRQACMAWARENNIQPPFPVGSMIAEGEITGIYEHDGACYEVRKPGDTDPTRRYIIRFEDARLATDGPARPPQDEAELEAEMQAAQDAYEAEQALRESAQELWAERGGYAAGLPRPI